MSDWFSLTSIDGVARGSHIRLPAATQHQTRRIRQTNKDLLPRKMRLARVKSPSDYYKLSLLPKDYHLWSIVNFTQILIIIKLSQMS